MLFVASFRHELSQTVSDRTHIPPSTSDLRLDASLKTILLLSMLSHVLDNFSVEEI